MQNDRDWVKDYYVDKNYDDAPVDVITPPEEEPTPTPPVDAVHPIEPEPTPTADAEPVVTPTQPDVPTPPVEYKSTKKYIPLENEEEIYNKLNQKYGYAKLSDEQKAMSYLKAQNPTLTDNQLAFLAAEKYGIGVEAPNEEDLTSDQIKALRFQDIDRSTLYSQAKSHFETLAEQVQLDAVDPLDTDEGYKQWATDTQTRQQQAQAQEERLNLLRQNIETAAKEISDISETLEIDIDDRKLAVDVNFKLSAEKQAQLIDFADRYKPSDAEVKQFTNSQTGQVDFKGYLTYLSRMVFAKDMAVASMRQGITKKMDDFIQGELKNSTLRANETSRLVDVKVDPNDFYWDRVAGK